MMKLLACWQAQDVLAVFEKMNTRPGGPLSVITLWHSLEKGDVVSVGVNWLVSAGYVEMKHDQTAVILTEMGYRKITGNEPNVESASLAAALNARRAVILVALEVETRAVLRHLPGWKDDVVRDTVFYRGRFENWDVAVADSNKEDEFFARGRTGRLGSTRC